MTQSRYDTFFYKTKSGRKSFMKAQLAEALLSDVEVEWLKLGKLTPEIKVNLTARFLTDVKELFKYNKVPSTRYNTFYQFLLKQVPKVFEDIDKVKVEVKKRKSKNRFKSKFDFGTDFDNFTYGTEFDYLSDFDDHVDNLRRWSFKSSEKTAAISKVAIYKTYLGIKVDEELTLELITKKYRELSKTKHPDVGGNPEEFMAITEAKDFLLNHIGKGL